MPHKLWTVVLLSSPYSKLTYKVPDYFPTDNFLPGMRVIVPLGGGNSLRIAVLLHKEDFFSGKKLKTIFWPLEREPVLSECYLDLARDLSRRHLSSPGRVLASMLPRQLKEQPACLKVHSGNNKKFKIKEVFNDTELIEWCAFKWRAEEIDFPAFKPRDYAGILDTNVEPPWPLLPNAIKQREVMDYIWTNGACSKAAVVHNFGPGIYPVLRRLQEKKMLVPVEADNEPVGSEYVCSTPVLTRQKDDALNRIRTGLCSERPCCSALHGVTGSGKTRVYIELARETLAAGGNVLVLAPEVALARQLYLAMRTQINEYEIFLQHGGLTPSVRTEMFLRLARKKEPYLLVGTRSSLFMITTPPRLIVLDEEHDESFKQDSNMTYQAKEVAFYWIVQNSGLLLLGSATPDIKTYWATTQKNIELVSMPERVSGKKLPEIELVDLNVDPPAQGPLAGSVHQSLMEVLDRGEQAIIMHNRRGYSPLLYCQNCQEIARCPDCHVSLTYHKKRNALLCHYCGATASFPLVCRLCGYSSFIPLGEGTEKLEEYFRVHLNNIDVLRLDRDNVRKKGRLEEILSDFSEKKAQILVGTQMISKGHNFPGVTLVIVVDGDLGLNLPDYRATERVFQMLVQVAGRAGRGESPGKVLIQTNNPSHYCWQHIKRGDYDSFFVEEIRRRKKFSYPPFCRLGLVRCTFPWGWSKREQALKIFSELATQLAKKYNLRLLGPAPAPLHKLNGRERQQCLVKSGEWPDIRRFFHYIRHGMQNFKQCRVTLDLDPLNML